MWQRALLLAMAIGVSGSMDTAAQITIVGDSVAHGAGDESGRGIGGNLADILHERVVNLGMNGARTWNVLAALRGRATRAAINSSQAVVLSIGGNDLFGDSRARFFSTVAPAAMMQFAQQRVQAIVNGIHTLNPRARVYILGLYDPYRRSPIAPWLDRQIALWDSRLIARFARDPVVDVIRIADIFAFTARLSPLDHFHPGAAGYALIAQRIAQTR